MHSVIIELAQLVLVGTRITYQAIGDAGFYMLYSFYCKYLCRVSSVFHTEDQPSDLAACSKLQTALLHSFYCEYLCRVSSAFQTEDQPSDLAACSKLQTALLPSYLVYYTLYSYSYQVRIIPTYSNLDFFFTASREADHEKFKYILVHGWNISAFV